MNKKINIKDKKENVKEHKKPKVATMSIAIFVIVLTIFSGYSMAKYVHETIINGNAQIAEPILVVENNPSMDITALNNYGEYVFKIKNYNKQNKLTEEDLKYYIEILSNVDDSINIELYEGENRVQLNNNKTEYIKISKDKKEEKQYKILITYDKNKTNFMSDIMGKIQVKVHTEQVKA